MIGDITVLLSKAARGDVHALGAVFVRVYPELRRLAQMRLERGEATLTPTVLVHEAYLRLIENDQLALNDRRHFFACASRAMRCIVIDQARQHFAQKRGSGLQHVTLSGLELSDSDDAAELLALDQALERLDQVNPRQREVVEMHYFGGLEFDEIAELTQCSLRTAKREWERARAFLYANLAA